ncbi:intraflagellar transport protein, putative [Ichthyophthirius multifiliis]|uniref:Intraflagellar transport protein 122 homolog n=1 Tax=Ichthyophthirius multifiliis TaxID=5932 RepID=G0QYZ6_ICHMU|nr:intraflagellar transport protein, putative [Ichthyophthirius multifiliis]EGR29567.1 intraflagellar transport protein, putative [Ichthyophthirius multifiliis]|eukprot:XP_004030803.1 intraflagellar transport protein, putative [Ichthyophthirius multifiliis]
MQCQELWTEIIPKPSDPNSNLTNQVWCTCFNNDGTVVLACVGDAILAYDVQSGEMLNKPIRGAQKEQINCIRFSKDGKRFATASNDKTVWIWKFDIQQNPKISAEVKYSHNDKVYCLSFNPLTQQIFSGGINDYSVWTPDQANIEKGKYKDKIITCAWSADGLYIAFGTMSGQICIKNRLMEIKAEINRSAPIWCMDWTPVTPDFQDSNLLVGVWEGCLSFYNIQGQQLGNDKKLGFDPLDINFSSQGEFYLVSGTNKKSTLYTRDGGFLIDVVQKNDWVWSGKFKPIVKQLGGVNNDQLYVSFSTNDGVIGISKIQQLTVHGLYKNRYAYRDNLTDIVVQNMSVNQKIRIKCKELIKNVSIYKEKLAAHLSERILVYVSNSDDSQLKYKLLKRMVKKIDAQIMEVLTSHILVAIKNKLQILQFSGDLEREWIFDSTIRSIKILGGMSGKEGAIIGLKNGQVYKIFIDNSFPIQVINLNVPIRMIDISQKKKKIAIVDDNNNLTVYDVFQKEQIYQEMNVLSCAFNYDFDDMLTYSGNDMTFIKSSGHPPLSQRMSGNVVGFKGNKLFVLNENVLSTIDISMTQTMLKYLEKKDFQQAYEVALLGVTDADLLHLGNEALIASQFMIAKKCYVKLKKLDFVYLLERAERDKIKNQFNESIYQGELFALQQKFHEAENAFVKANQRQKAKEMYITLKDFTKAKRVANSEVLTPQSRQGQRQGSPKNDNGFVQEKSKELIKQEAEWKQKTGDWKEAGELFKDYLMYQGQLMWRLREKKLKYVWHILKLEKWEEALVLAKSNPELLELVKLPYANWLSRQDRFEEALKAYRKIGQSEYSTKMLQKLSQNAVYEKRFTDATLYFWMISTEYLNLVKNGKQPSLEDQQNIKLFQQYREYAQIYFAYSKIHQFVEEPFLPLSGHQYMLNIFNAARFAINKLGNRSLYGVKHSYLYYSLGKVSKQLEAYKTARICYEKLAGYKIPSDWTEEIELSSLLVRSKVYSDAENLLPICSRCMNQNPVLTEGNKCSSCLHSFVNCFLSFENLPVVEFKVNQNINHKKVIELINSDKSKIPKTQKKKKVDDGWQENNLGDQQVLTFNQSPNKNNVENSAFIDKLQEIFEMQQTTQEYIPLQLDEQVLCTLNMDEVYCVDFTRYCLTYDITYYKSMNNDVLLKVCNECCSFFILDEYEFEFIKNGKCSFCRIADERTGVQKDIFDL